MGNDPGLECVAVCCGVLQHVAVCALIGGQRSGTVPWVLAHYVGFAVCCSALQHVVVCCSVLQCVAVGPKSFSWVCNSKETKIFS